MAVNSSTAGIVLLIVSVLGVAAVGGVIGYEYQNADNPNGILGVYAVAEYTQGGIGPDGQWHWYETGDGTYDGEMIAIEQYKDGFVKGSVYLGNDKFTLNGFYDPVSCAFGYTSYYDYSPESRSGVVDLLYGSIWRDVMILTGYTVSSTDGSQAYAFNFIFTKNGAPYENPFTKVGKVDKYGALFVNTLDANTGKDEKIEGQYSYEILDYRNGVYQFRINDSETLAAAVTVIQEPNSDTAALRCVHFEKGSLCSEWIILSDFSLYSFSCDSWDCSKSTVFRHGYKFETGKSFGAKTASVSMQSSSDWKRYDYEYSIMSDTFHQNTSSLVVTNKTLNTKYIMNEWGTKNYQETNIVSFMCKFSVGGVDYYGEMLGYFSMGGLHLFGFLITSEGDTLAVNEVIGK